MKKFICLLLALVMVFALVGCGKTETPAAPASNPSAPASTPSSSASTPSTPAAAPDPAAADPCAEFVSINIGVTNYLGRFIQGLSPTECLSAGYAVFDQIFRASAATHEIVSDVLTDWYWEDDTTFIMVLDPKVTFSNGDKATSADLLYSYTSFFDRDSSEIVDFHLILDECVTRDDYTVALKFEKPYRLMENVKVNLLDKAWCESVGWDSLDWYYPVGSGPYICTDYQVDDHITLQARDDYWNSEKLGPIYVDEYKIQYYKDASTMEMDLETGKLDFCELQPTDYSRYLKNGGNGYEAVVVSTGVTMFWCPAMLGTDVWSEYDIRYAAAIGVNWDQVGEAVRGDLFVPADSMAPKTSPDHIVPGTYGYDPDKAKEILAGYGFTAENPMKIHAVIMDTETYKSFAEAIQFQFSQINIDMEVEFLDIPGTLEYWNTPGGTDICMQYNNYGSPTCDLYDSISRARQHERSTWMYRDTPEFNDAFEKLCNYTDPAIWKQAAKDIQQIMFDQVLYVPFAEMTSSFAYRTDVLTEAQCNNIIVASNMYELDTLGYLSSWQ